MKLYNTTKIIKAINENKQKFDILRDIATNILEVREDKKKQEKFIEKIYGVVLKNLSSSKKEIKGMSYTVCNTGISKKSNYSRNAQSITQQDKGEFFKSLIEVKDNLSAFLEVLSPTKKKVLKKFLEKVNLLKEKEPVSTDINTKIEWVVDGKKEIDMLEIDYQYSYEIFINFKSGWGNKIKIVNPDFKDYVIIEQLYNQIKKVLEMELKQNKYELENMQKFLVDMDNKFSSYIKSVETLNELNKGD